MWLLARARPAAPIVVAALLFAGPRAARADEKSEKRACITASEEGQSLRDDHKLTRAREQLRFCARDACPALLRKDCAQWLSDVEASLPSVVLVAEDADHGDLADVKVSIDGQPLVERLDGRAVFVDPGPHTFHFELDGEPPFDARVVVREGDKNRSITAMFHGRAVAAPAAQTAASPAPVEPPDEPRQRGLPAATYVLGGLGFVALGSFAYFGVTGKNDVSNLRDTCGAAHACAQQDVDAARTKLLVADISLGVGIVALGLATYFALSRGPAPPNDGAKARDARRGRGAVRFAAAPIASGAFAGLHATF